MALRYFDRPILHKPKFTGEPTDQVKFRVNTTVAATGTLQSDAAAIVPGVTLVSGADDAKGVILQNGVPGDVYIIKVGDGADLKVWPPTGAAINAIAADSAITVVDDVCFMIVQYSATQFYTLPLLPS